MLNNLRQLGIQVYRTDEQGTIVAVSDGKDITWNTQSSESWQSGEQSGSGQSVEAESSSGSDGSESEETTYILNTNTMKIHRIGCSSIDDMSEKNKEETNKTVEELKAEGYEPCKRCNP